MPGEEDLTGLERTWRELAHPAHHYLTGTETTAGAGTVWRIEKRTKETTETTGEIGETTEEMIEETIETIGETIEEGRITEMIEMTEDTEDEEFVVLLNCVTSTTPTFSMLVVDFITNHSTFSQRTIQCQNQEARSRL